MFKLALQLSTSTEEVGHDDMLPFRNLINTTRHCLFCAKYGWLKFMLSPRGMDLTNECLVQILKRVCLCVQPGAYEGKEHTTYIAYNQGLIDRRRRERACNYVTHQNSNRVYI